VPYREVARRERLALVSAEAAGVFEESVEVPVATFAEAGFGARAFTAARAPS
jgi:hypothetical protein